MLSKKVSRSLSSALIITFLCCGRIIAQADVEEKCSCSSWSLSRESNINCKVISDCEIASHPPLSAFTMENAKVRMKPRKEGLVITWMTRFGEDEALPVAYFTLERNFTVKTSCNLIILNITKDSHYTRKTNASVELDCASNKSASGRKYTLKLVPKGAITLDFPVNPPDIFTGQVLVPPDHEGGGDVWLASAFVQQQQENCSKNSHLLLTFSPPHFRIEEPYRVRICIESSDCDSVVRTFVTRKTEVAFYNVTPGNYFIWISPDNEYDGNSASSDYVSVLDYLTPTWSSDLNITSFCRIHDNTCCAEINYQPAESALRYEGYTVYVRSGETKLEAQKVADKHDGHAMVCDLAPGLYDIEVFPHGTCPQWIKSMNSTLSLNVIEPLTTIDSKTISVIIGILTTAAVLGCIFVALLCLNKTTQLWKEFSRSCL